MKKVVSILIILTLILGMAGCGRGKTKNTTGPRPQGPKTGPIGTWDIPIPEINPLGSQDLYSSTGHEFGTSHHVKYIENFAEVTKTMDGEMWTLEVEDPSGIPLTFLKEYAQGIGANIFANQYGDRLTFSFKKDENSLWWGDAFQSDTGYTLYVIKELHIPMGKEVKFNLASLGDEAENISFVTSSEGKRFQTATIKIPDGALNLQITSEYSTGIVKRRVDYRKELSTQKTNTFVLDDLPQGQDTLKWNFTWEEAPSEFSVLLEELKEIPEVKLGDELGALKVCGVPFGDVVVEPPQNVDIEYIDGYSLRGDITPEGDTLFWLPAGLWNVVLLAEGVGLDDSKVRMVPVNTGETTVLTFPNSLKSAYGNLSSIFAEPENYTGGIEFMEAKDMGSTASISMLVHDPQNRDIFPTKENTVIFEGGKEVKITDITRQIAPPSVVLVLDSSGSMGKQMPATISAAREFIKGLPDKTFIKVIDFDSQIRVLKGENKETVSKSLSSITASGSTMLFDATLEGLELLRGKTRPALVVFADGADSSIDGQGAGSSSTKEEVVEAIQEAKIPVYTIGFGDKPDEKALREFSIASGGEYYSAKDEKALANVFTAIGSKFGNSFIMTYERPKEASLANTPVISIVLDASGSMDTDPSEEEGCGFRMDKTKALFHDFILKLPEDCLMQMTSFQTGALGGPIIRQQQVTTGDKMRLLQGLGELNPSGGTPILDAIRIGYENLKSVATNKKVMVFLTDAALEVDEEQQQAFEKLLAEIKKDNINVLWAGMGVEDKKEVFIKAAELSGGRYVVSEDALGLQSTLEEILAFIKKEASTQETIPLSVTINDKNTKGEVLSYAANTSVAFTKPPKSGAVIEPDIFQLATGLPMKRYGQDVAALVTGTGVPGVDTILTKRISFTAKESNKAAELAVKEAYYFSKFKGLEPPESKQFLALELEIKNVTSEKIPYQIPSFHNHFYVNINNEGSFPASNATWLTQLPLSPPGNPEVNVSPKENLKGMLVFLVPNVPIEQTSLHLYDTAYGHINIPLMGKMDKQLLEIDKLPTAEPVKISDAFSMTVTGSSVLDKVDIYPAEKNTSFRIVEAEFNSKVQALLDINPMERLWLRVNTSSGPLLTKMSDVTHALPFGFMAPTMLAPGSANKVRLAYPVANGLISAQADVWGDLASGSLQVPVVKGNSYGTNIIKGTASMKGLEVRVNQLTTLGDSLEDFNDYWVVADVTFTDIKDGFGTLVPEDCFQLVRQDYKEEFQGKTTAVKSGRVNLGDFASGGMSEGILAPNYKTYGMLYGIDQDWPVFDGAERRGIVLFSLTDDGYKWSLKSPYFEDLDIPLIKEPYQSPELLVNKTEINLVDKEFETKLAQMVRGEIERYNSVKGAMGNIGYLKTVNLGESDGKNNIPMPSIVTSGIQKINSVKNLADFTKTMTALKWVSGGTNNSWNYQYSPEAVLTQGWGTEWDLANLAMKLLAKCGCKPKLREIAVTDNGRARLLELSKVEVIPKDAIPGVSYLDEKGNEKLFVIPFMQDIKELEGLVYFPSSQFYASLGSKPTTIRVSMKVEGSGGSAAGTMSDIADVLGGGDGDAKSTDYVEMLVKELPLATLSQDAIEIAYPKAGTGQGVQYMAAISTSEGLTGGTVAIDSGQNKILGVRIEVGLPSGTYTHESTLAEGETPDKLYHTLAINLPDLPKASAKVLEEATNKEYKAAENPNSISALKWYSRNIINRFITNQTIFDEEISEDLKLTLGRTDKERLIVLTSRMDTKSNKMRTTIDLLQATNQCQNGDKNTQIAYNISAGMFASSLEGKALTGKDTTNFIDLWANAPKGTAILVIPPDYEGSESRRAIAEEMAKSGNYPERLIDRVANSKKAIFTPDKPTDFDGEKRWAWLEIDPETYEAISVLDTGEHGAFVDYLLTRESDLLNGIGEDGMRYLIGAFAGVDVSIWSVAGASLKHGDYDKILKEAMAVAAEVGKAIGELLKYTDMVAKKQINWSPELGSSPINVEFKLSLADAFEARLKQNLLNFETGFKDGMAVYFTAAKKAK
ncbi:MAG: vWA domain-containing protein [Peptococcales bacterium]